MSVEFASCVCSLWGGVNQYATHGLSCRWSQARHSRHGEINYIIHRSLVFAKVPSRLEPSGLLRSDGKRPDGMTIIPWSRGQLLVWDATCCDIFAALYIGAAVSEPGVVAAKAEEKQGVQVLPSRCLLSVCASGGGNMRYFRASSGGVFQGAGTAGEEGYS